MKELARKYYLQGYNCAEAILRAGNEFYNLNMDENSMRLAAAFGGGMQVGDICGALSGACMVVSLKYVETKAHDQASELRTITTKLIRAFQNHFASRVCAKIKVNFFDPEVKCLNTVSDAAVVLEKVIKEYDEELLRNF